MGQERYQKKYQKNGQGNFHIISNNESWQCIWNWEYCFKLVLKILKINEAVNFNDAQLKSVLYTVL